MLLINSSDENAFIALYDGADLLVSYASEFQKSVSKKQPDNLISSLNLIKENHQENFKQIKAIAVTIGPGSFTGIRVGLAIAKGVAAAYDIPLIPLTNFELIFCRVPESIKRGTCCILIPAKMPEYYYSIIQNGNETGKGCAIFDEIAQIVEKNAAIVGFFDAESKTKHSYFEYLNNENLSSEPDSMLKIALDRFESGVLAKPEETEPLYMKDFVFRK